MSSEYFTLLAQWSHLEKLSIDNEVLTDPFLVFLDLWMEDMTQWLGLL